MTYIPIVIGQSVSLDDSTGGIDINSGSADNLITWSQNTHIDTQAFEHSTTTNPARVKVTTGGSYLITVNISHSMVSLYQGNLKVRKNGTTTVTQGPVGPIAGGLLTIPPIVISLAPDDYIEILTDRVGAVTSAVTTLAQGTTLTMVKLS